MKKHTSSLLFTSLCLIMACDGTKKDSQTTETIIDTAQPPVVQSLQDSVAIPAFEISIDLSRKATKKLKSSHETVVINTYFSGIPVDQTLPEFLNSGEVSLLSHSVELTDGRSLKLDDLKISKAAYDALADKNFNVLVNVFSGRKSTTSNILDGEVLQGKISHLQGKKHTLKVDLLK